MSVQEPIAQLRWLDSRGQLTPEAHIYLLQLTQAVNTATSDIATIKTQIAALDARVTALEP